MRLMLHILKKDARRLSWQIIVTLVLLAALVRADSQREDYVPGSMEGWLNLLLPAERFLPAVALQSGHDKTGCEGVTCPSPVHDVDARWFRACHLRPLLEQHGSLGPKRERCQARRLRQSLKLVAVNDDDLSGAHKARRDPASRLGALRRVGEQLGINPETLRGAAGGDGRWRAAGDDAHRWAAAGRAGR